jgi:predicted dehydrogenase
VTSSIAFVGCGALVEQQYLPALRTATGVRCEALIDPDRSRIDRLAARYGIAVATTSIEDIPKSVTGVIVAAPNEFHTPIVVSALRQSLDVLCEKPVGRGRAEVQEMVDAATASGRTLYAAMICRRFPSVAGVVQGQLQHLVGDLEAVNMTYGFPLDWPITSMAVYDKARAGGGALLDGGVHLIDALLYVVGAVPYEIVEYQDDGESGVEAEGAGRLELYVQNRRVECLLRTSRLRRLANAIVLRGTRGTLTIPLLATEAATFSHAGGVWPVTGCYRNAQTCFVEQLANFGKAIRGEPNDLPTGTTQLTAMEIIDRLYAVRTPLEFAWNG